MTVLGCIQTSARAQALLVLGVSTVAMFTCGSQYSISAWSPNLKTELNCSQSEIETVGTLGNVGAYLGPISGVLVYNLPELWVGFICCFFLLMGLIPMGLAAQHQTGLWSHFRAPPTLGGLFALSGFGSATLYSLLITVNLGNVPVNRRGTVVAFMATLLGLSASVYTAIYNGPLDSNVGSLLILMGIVIGIAAFLSALFVRRVDPNEAWNNGSLLVDASAILLQEHDSDIYVPVDSVSNLPTGARLNNSLNSRDSIDDLDEDDADEDERIARVKKADAELQIEYTKRTCGGGLFGSFFGSIWFLMHKVTYWLLLIIFFLTAGAGLCVINNTGHVVQSLNGGKQDGSLVSFLILMLSLANGSGRLLMACSDYIPVRKGVWLTATCMLMTVGQFLNAFVFIEKELVIYGVIMVALAYGALWSIVPIIVSDTWGPAGFSMNFGWVGCISGLASMMFNSFAGRFYDQHTVDGANECIGPICYRYSFILNGCAAALACALSLFLIPRTDFGKKQKTSADVAPVNGRK